MPRGGGAKVTAVLDIQAQITSYQDSLNRLQKGLDQIHLSDNLKKSFTSIFDNFQSELDKLQKSTASGKLSIVNEKSVSASFDKIENMYANLIKKLNDSGYKESILEKDFKAIEEMKKAEADYRKEVKSTAAEYEKEKDKLDQLTNKLKEQKKVQGQLGREKGGLTTAQNKAEAAAKKATDALKEQDAVVKNLSNENKKQEAVISKTQSAQERYSKAALAAEEKLEAYRKAHEGKQGWENNVEAIKLANSVASNTQKATDAQVKLNEERAKGEQISQSLAAAQDKQAQLQEAAASKQEKLTDAQEKTNRKVKEYNDSVRSSQAVEAQIGEQTKLVEDKEAAYNKLVSETLVKVITAFKEVAEAAGVDTSSLKSIEDIQKAYEDLSNEAKSNVVPAEEAINKAQKDVANSGNAMSEAIQTASGTLHELTDRQKEIQRLSDSILRFFSVDNAVRLFKRAVRSAYETVKDLDAVMTETAVVTDFDVGDMWSQLPEYTKRANELGVSIHDVYEASTLYYQQGLKTNEVMQVTNATLRMARIASLDAAEATDRVTNALRGFNMEINESNADRIADVYSKLAAMSASNVDEISTAMTKVASLANSANMEFETTAAFLSQIIETTRESAETAGTALKTVVARFSEVKKLYGEGQLLGTDSEGEEIDVNKVSTALRAANINLNEFLTGSKGLDDIFIELASKWDNLDIVTQRYIATMAAGSRQQSRFIALMSDYGRTQELVSAAQNASGASMQQYEKTLESLQSKLARLKNAWDEFVTGIANSEFIKRAVDGLTSLLNALNKISAGSNSTVKSITNISIALGGLFVGKKLFNGLLSSVGKAFLGAGQNAAREFGDGFLGNMDKIAKIKSVFTKDFWIGFGDLSTHFKPLEDSLNNIATAEANLEAIRKSSTATIAEREAAEAALAGAQLQNEAVLQSLNIDEATYNAVKQTGLTTQEQAILLNGSEASQRVLNAMAEDDLTAAEIRELMAKEGLNKQTKLGLLWQIAHVAQLGLEKIGIDVTTSAIYSKIMASKIENAVLKENIALMVASLGPIAAIVAALGALVAAIIIISANTKTLDFKEQIEDTNNALDELRDSTEKEREELDKLKTSLDKLSEDYEIIDSLTKGTDSWKEKVHETNEEVKELIGTFSEYGKYVSFDAETGMLKFDVEQARNDGTLTEREKRATAASVGGRELEVKSAEYEYADFIQRITREYFADNNYKESHYLNWQELGEAYSRGDFRDKDTFEQYFKDLYGDRKELPEYEDILSNLKAIAGMYEDLQNKIKSTSNIITSELVDVAKLDYEGKNGSLTEEEDKIFTLVASSVKDFYEDFTDYTNKEFQAYIMQQYKGAVFEDDGVYVNGEKKLDKKAALTEYSAYRSGNNAIEEVTNRYNQISQIKDKDTKQLVANLLGGVLDDSIEDLDAKDFASKLDKENISGPFLDIIFDAFNNMQSKIKTQRDDLIGEEGKLKNVKVPEDATIKELQSYWDKIKDFSSAQIKELNKIIVDIPIEERTDFWKDFSELNFLDIDALTEFSNKWGTDVTQKLIETTDVAKNFDIAPIFEKLQEAWKIAESYKGKNEMSDEDFQKISAATGGLLKDQFTYDEISKTWYYQGVEAIEQAIINAAKTVAEQKLAISGNEGALEQDRYSEVMSEASLGGYDTSELKAKAKVLEDTKELSKETAAGVALINEKLNKGLEKILDNYEDWNKLIDENGKLISDLGADDLKIYDSLKSSLKEMLNVEGDLSDSFLEENIEDIRALAKGGEEAEQALARLQKAASMDYLTKLKIDASDIDGAEKEITDFENWVSDIDIPKLEVGAKWTGESAQSFIDRFNAMAKAAGLSASQIRDYFSKIGFDVELEETPIYEKRYVWVQDPIIDQYGYFMGKSKPRGFLINQYVGTAVAVKTMTSTGSSGGGISHKNAGGVGSSGGGGGGGGSSGSDKTEKPKNWKNPYDELYNLNEEINETIRQRNILEKEYDILLEDHNSALSSLYGNSVKEVRNLERQLKLEKQMQAGRKKQLLNVGQETYEDSEGNIKTFEELGVTKYAKYDFNTGTIVIDYAALQKLENTPGSEEEGKAVEAYISAIEERASQYEEGDEKLLEIQSLIMEIQKRGIQELVDLQNRTMEAFVNARQAIIDGYQALSDSIDEATNKVIESVEEQVAAERQARQDQETEQNIADKEARLAYLQRDTSGANDLEIMKLQDELANDRQNYTDSLIDQAINQMREDAEKASEQRNAQISLMQQQLENDKKNGVFWEAVDATLDAAFNETSGIMTTAEIMGENVEGTLFGDTFISKTGEAFSTYTDGDGNVKITGIDGTDIGMVNGKGTVVSGVQNLNNLLKGSEETNIMSKEGDYLFGDDLLKSVKQAYQGKQNAQQAISNDKVLTTTSSSKKTVTTAANINKTVVTTTTTSSNNNTSKKITTVANADATKSYTEKQKYGVALAILNNAKDSGWGSGDERKKNLKSKGFNADEIQTLVNELSDIDNKVKKINGKFTDSNSYLKDKYGITTSKDYYMNKFKSGGLVNFTGPAWLDGTKSKPEIVLNQSDSENFLKLRDILSQLMSTTTTLNQTKVGDAYYEIKIDAEIANDYDVDQLAARIKKQIYDDSMYRNVNSISLMR